MANWLQQQVLGVVHSELFLLEHLYRAGNAEVFSSFEITRNGW